MPTAGAMKRYTKLKGGSSQLYWRERQDTGLGSRLSTRVAMMGKEGCNKQAVMPRAVDARGKWHLKWKRITGWGIRAGVMFC